MINFKNGDIVITSDYHKKSILRYINDNKILVNLKFYTLEQFKNKYFGTYNEKAVYYLMKKYNYKYDIAKMYLDNFNYIDSLKIDLLENNLIVKEKMNISRIIVIGYSKIDNYIKKEIEKYDHIYDESNEENYLHSVYEFSTILDEVNFVILKITELLKTVNINKIFLVNAGDEYNLLIKRMFKFHNIPINIDCKKNVYGTMIVKEFLKNLKEKRKIILNENEISNIIMDIVNKYSFTEIDDVVIDCIENTLKKTFIECNRIKNAVNIVDIDEICDDNYYFVMGLNQGILPRIHKDEDFLSDNEKKRNLILTSFEKNLIEKEYVKNKIISTKNLFLTYKLKSNKEVFYPSSIIDELELEIKKIDIENYNSDIYNEINLARKIDNLIKYNVKDKELSKLYSNYQNINYLKYDNKFTGINKKDLYKYINNKLVLSYTSLDNYNRCAFKYYINNILKLDLFEETFMKYIGDLFHYILSICNNEDFDFEMEFNKFLVDKQLSNKELHFINKLKKDLLFTIDTIKKHDSYSELNDALYEEKIFVEKDTDIKVTFMGVVDKIKYKKENEQVYVAIIDYKTGNPKISLDNIDYGIGMQLPIYLYLVKNSKLKNIKFIGFYLQKIVHNKLSFDSKKDYNSELSKQYRLEGYSTNNEEYLKMFDKTYMDSLMIKGMKISSKGFYSYSKTLSTEDIEELINIVDNKINESIDNILEAKFDINPKKIENDLIGCEYCNYKDICFKKEEDIIKLKEIKFESRCIDA